MYQYQMLDSIYNSSNKNQKNNMAIKNPNFGRSAIQQLLFKAILLLIIASVTVHAQNLSNNKAKKQIQSEIQGSPSKLGGLKILQPIQVTPQAIKDLPKIKNTEVPKVVWLFYTQFEKIPEGLYPIYWHIVSRAEQSNYKVNLVNDSTVFDFLSDKQSFRRATTTQFCSTPQKKSDLVRMALLREHGGVWMDLSAVLIESLEWIQQMIEEGLGLQINEISDSSQKRIKQPRILPYLYNNDLLGRGHPFDVFLFHNPEHQYSAKYRFEHRTLNTDNVPFVQKGYHYQPGYETFFIVAIPGSKFMIDSVQRFNQVCELSHEQHMKQIYNRNIYPRHLGPSSYFRVYFIWYELLQLKQRELDSQISLFDFRPIHQRPSSEAYYNIWTINCRIGPYRYTFQNPAFLLSETSQEEVASRFKYLQENFGQQRFFFKQHHFTPFTLEVIYSEVKQYTDRNFGNGQLNRIKNKTEQRSNRCDLKVYILQNSFYRKYIMQNNSFFRTKSSSDDLQNENNLNQTQLKVFSQKEITELSFECFSKSLDEGLRDSENDEEPNLKSNEKAFHINHFKIEPNSHSLIYDDYYGPNYLISFLTFTGIMTLAILLIGLGVAGDISQIISNAYPANSTSILNHLFATLSPKEQESKPAWVQIAFSFSISALYIFLVSFVVFSSLIVDIFGWREQKYSETMLFLVIFLIFNRLLSNIQQSLSLSSSTKISTEEMFCAVICAVIDFINPLVRFSLCNIVSELLFNFKTFNFLFSFVYAILMPIVNIQLESYYLHDCFFLERVKNFYLRTLKSSFCIYLSLWFCLIITVHPTLIHFMVGDTYFLQWAFYLVSATYIGSGIILWSFQWILVANSAYSLEQKAKSSTGQNWASGISVSFEFGSKPAQLWIRQRPIPDEGMLTDSRMIISSRQGEVIQKDIFMTVNLIVWMGVFYLFNEYFALQLTKGYETVHIYLVFMVLWMRINYEYHIGRFRAIVNLQQSNNQKTGLRHWVIKVVEGMTYQSLLMLAIFSCLWMFTDNFVLTLKDFRGVFLILVGLDFMMLTVILPLVRIPQRPECNRVYDRQLQETSQNSMVFGEEKESP